MTGFPTTTTYGSLVDEIIGGLQAYTFQPDAMTVLTESVSNSDTRFKVEDSTNTARGLVEIGNELIYIKGVDEAASELQTNAAWRGFRGTAAEPHAVGETVTFSPTFARSVVRREINNVILSLWPNVFGVGAVELTGATTTPSVSLPADAMRVIDVRVKRDTLEGWVPVREWSVTHTAPSEFATRVTLDLYGTICGGYTVQVVYAKAPTPLANNDDAFSACGLGERCKDIVVYGVQWRLAQNLDLARLPAVAAEADEMDANKQTGAAVQIANTFYKLHQAAVERERSALNIQYPARSHKVR